MMELIRSAYDWWIAKLRAIRHSKPPEPPMRLRLHEAGYAVVGYRFGYTQQGIMLREDDTGETSQQYATGMDDDMSVRLQTETIISMAGFAVTLEYPEYRTDALRIGGDVQSELVNAAIIHRIDPAMGCLSILIQTCSCAVFDGRFLFHRVPSPAGWLRRWLRGCHPPQA